MFEMFINPKLAERRPWELFFIGALYSSVALLLVSFVFVKDSILREGAGLLIVLFTVICCLPYVYYLIKQEEGKDVQISNEGKLIREHSKAIYGLMWMFLGFVVALSLWYLILPQYAPQNFNFQIKTFCAINSPTNFQNCIEQQGVNVVTGNVTKPSYVLNIFANNVYVLIFTILFSLAFGAGAIFILIWNASVIAAAVGIFSRSSFSRIPLGIGRYMIHGIPEISAYFIGALAGGIVSVAIIRKDLEGERTWRILQDSLILVIIAIVILVVSALMEVYLTPLLF